MLKPKRNIRIIKGDRHETNDVPAQKARASRNPNREVARQVAGWVREINQNRRTESLRTFASLFGPNVPVKSVS